MPKRGRKITREGGEMIANDFRKRRFNHTRRRAHFNRAVLENVLRHVKTKADCVARNITTGAMTKVLCDLYIVAEDGTLIDSTEDIYVFNPGGLVTSGTWMTILLNEAGQYEFVVARCGT